MSAKVVITADRREFPRFTELELQVDLRLKGRLHKLSGPVVDFNRHGLAVVVPRRLKKDQHVFLDLRSQNRSLGEVVGIVHNCCGVNKLKNSKLFEKYRCGIAFRTQAPWQLDRSHIERMLEGLEDSLVDYVPGPLKIR